MQLTEEVIIKLRDEFTTAAKNITKEAFSMKEAFVAVAGAFTVLKGLEFLKDSVKAFVEQEKLTLELKSALKGLGVQSQSTVKDYEEFARAIQRTSFYTEEQTLSAERLLAQFHIVGDDMKKTILVALDLATAKGIDLQQAITMIIKASEGNVTAFQRMGVKISETTIQTKGLNGVLDTLEKSFGGTAKAAQEGLGFAINQVGKNVEDFQKSLGSLIAQLDKKYGFTAFLAEGTQAWVDKMDEGKKKVRAMTDEIKSLGDQIDQIQNNKTVFGFDSIFPNGNKEGQAKALEDLNKKYAEAVQRLADYNKTANETNKIDEKKLHNINAIREAPKYLKDSDEQSYKSFLDFKDKIDSKNESSFKKLDNERKTDQRKLDEYYTVNIKKDNNYTETKKKIDRDYFLGMIHEATSTANEAASGMEDAFKTMQSNVGLGFSKMSTTVLSTIGKVSGNKSFGMAGEVIASVTGIIQSVSAVFAMFDHDARSSFSKLHDYITQINSDIQASINQLKDLERQQAKNQGGEAGTLNFEGVDVAGDAGAAFGGEAPTYNAKHGGFTVSFSEVIRRLLAEGTLGWDIDDSTGYFSVIWDGTTLGSYNPISGAWTVVHVIYRDFTNSNAQAQKLTLDVMKFVLFEAKKQGLNIGSLGVAQSDRPSQGSGGVVFGTPNGSGGGGSQNPMGSSYGGNSYGEPGSYNPASPYTYPPPTPINIYIDTIDEQGVADFLRTKLAPAMRQATARDNLVLIHSRGMSANV